MKCIKLKELLNEIFDDTDSLDAHKVMNKINLDDFTKSYISTALWSSTDNLESNGGDPLDKKYTIDDIESSTLHRMIKDCKDFQKKYNDLYERGGWDDNKAGYDFWLTRNYHGTGFWDRAYGQPDEIEIIGKQLTEASKQYGEYNLYLGDGAYDGLICGA